MASQENTAKFGHFECSFFQSGIFPRRGFFGGTNSITSLQYLEIHHRWARHFETRSYTMGWYGKMTHAWNDNWLPPDSMMHPVAGEEDLPIIVAAFINEM
jgi:hypothetical protein